jgi:transcription elongation factor GreA
MPDIHYLTAEGMEKLKKELDYLVSVERPAISKQIGEARDKGDLSENAEYDAAREAQGMCELKISKLKDLIANAKIIDESKVGTDKVQLLNKVKLQNLGNNSIMEFTIVAESEANIAQGKLASSTPIAKAILGKKKGDVVEARVPNGIIKLKVLEISI